MLVEHILFSFSMVIPRLSTDFGIAFFKTFKVIYLERLD